MRLPDFTVTEQFLINNPSIVFVYGENLDRYGTAGGAKLRHLPNTYGFVTKKHPDNEESSFYTPEQYKERLRFELANLLMNMMNNRELKYYISKVGSGLANKHNIWSLIEPELLRLESRYPNRITLLW